MVRIYGVSDDLVEIENSNYKDDEIGCYNSYVVFRFEDGTVIDVSYPKQNMAVWEIVVVHKGSADQHLLVCEDENAAVYSDIFEIDSEIVEHMVVDY